MGELAVSGVAPGVDALRFRQVLGHFPTGVVVVTALPGCAGGTAGEPVGMSVNAFTSVSLAPPLIGFLPAASSTTWPLIRDTGAFCVNILSEDQQALARTFASRDVDRFDSVRWKPAPLSGAPLLAGATAWIDCTLEGFSEAGDHHFVLARVRALGAHPDSKPLAFFRGEYHTLG